MGLGSRLKLDLCIFIFSVALFSSPVFSDLILSKLDRRIDLTSHIVRVTSNIKVENDGNEPISDFVVAFPDHQAKHLASLSAFHIEGKGKTKSRGASLPLKPVQSEGIPQSLISYSVSLPKKLVKGESLSLEVFAVFAHILKPFPEKVSQGDFQLVVFQDSAYYLSPYAVKVQTLSVKLPDARIESYTKLENSKAQGSEIKYGPYENQPPFSYSPVVVHFEYNKPYAVAQKLVREIEISHWGNVQITEHYNLVHGGAILKGEFSRLDHQMSSYAKGASSFSKLVAKLPPRAHSVYYRDEIGNISTSNLQSNSKKTELEIEPRYPLFGGWKTFFTFGYGLPLKDYLFEAEGKRFVNISFGSPIDELVVDELIVKVVLPEGSSDLSVSISFPVEQEQETKLSHLDISGRPVMVLRKVNAVPEHNQHFQVYYKFNCLSLLREPLMLISGFFFLFVAGIAYSHADFSISKSSASYLARVQREEVQTIIQQLENIINRCLAIHDKLEVSLRELSRTGNVQACKTARKAADNLLKELSKELKPLLTSLQLSPQATQIFPKVEELVTKERELQERLITKHSIVIDCYEKKLSGREIENRVAPHQQKITALKQDVDDLLEYIDEI
ncbi:dolichyl-diphosphooligosaccharide--protein glycosyltransferase subunit 1A-like [Chenopodium quinoa]|uniref:dolichyl-diphosphooligosaccharide--protein glycosyltransferase subunit 1A-like n=1 Tax=Chenopodium quinoa TaxID=63459 RepID=UPI000B785891|nr:dolichyl-diphosphooligosaccharide--protein glycosyltransferase subunit 1A-like [Chenopodium quinoa]